MMTHKAHLTIVHLYSKEGNAMGITTNPVYSHPETGETQVYLSQCVSPGAGRGGHTA